MTSFGEVYTLYNYIDTFALGHYARVLDAQDRRWGRSVALKVMRLEHLSPGNEPRWEYRAFANEAELLVKLSESPHIIGLYDCGFVSSGSEAPDGGEIESFGANVMHFTREIIGYSEKGWRPYLALENLPRTDNLFYLMRPDRSGGRFRLPTEEGISLALQFGETLRHAHRHGIVYLDHKMEHVYWDGVRLRVIDLNSSRQLEGSTRENEQYFRMDIHNLCVGILYPLFTGLSPLKSALRPQPGSLTDVEMRYREITTLDFGVEPTLSPKLIDLLQRGAGMDITSADEFIDGLQEVATHFGWDFPGHYTRAVNRDARAQMKAGIASLRQGQDCLRDAREHFREAAIQEGITEDLEAELRRLVKALNDMLNNRVIP
jgi:serine/threonine protein kinase